MIDIEDRRDCSCGQAAHPCAAWSIINVYHPPPVCPEEARSAVSKGSLGDDEENTTFINLYSNTNKLRQYLATSTQLQFISRRSVFFLIGIFFNFFELLRCNDDRFPIG